MIFKEDWEKCKERFEAFWEGEIIDRCLISIRAPRKEPLELGFEYRDPESLGQMWMDAEYIYNLTMYYYSRTYFGGDNFPNFLTNLGPGSVAAYMGASYILTDRTVWFDQNPIIKDWDDLSRIGFIEDSELWKATCEITRYFIERAKGKCFLCNTSLGGTLDIAAALRGPQQLLIDMYDNPDEVKELCKKIDDVWLLCYDRIQEMINGFQDGATDWFPTWCKGKRSYGIQSDFAALVSPPQFDEFVMPSLVKQAEFLDRAIYHLDGPEQIANLDKILSIDAIDGIQWVPVSWEKGGCDESWFPMYRKIQEKGKKLVISCIDVSKLEKLLDNVSPKGLYLMGIRCGTEDEARDLVKFVTAKCKGRR